MRKVLIMPLINYYKEFFQGSIHSFNMIYTSLYNNITLSIYLSSLRLYEFNMSKTQKKKTCSHLKVL